MTKNSEQQSFLSGFLNYDEEAELVDTVSTEDSLDVEKKVQEFQEKMELKTKFAETEKAITENMALIRKQYPQGGIRASRVINSHILKTAPDNFFERFMDDVNEGTSFVQNLLVVNGGSEIIAKSQDNPTDEAIQEKAFKEIHSLVLEFLGKKTWGAIERAILIQLITNEIIGFSMIDPLWRDRTINEIAVDGPFSVLVEVGGFWERARACKFRDREHLEQLLERLYQSVNKSLSRMSPQVKGRMHDGSRIFSVHRSAMPHGPSLNIRRHPEKHWEPRELVEKGSCSAEVMTTIGNLIYKGCSFLVVGGTSTGKTTTLNALTGFYRDNVRILTIEDSLEMKPNPHKMLAPGMETLPARGENDKGVTIRDLVKGSLQMAPNVIIVGESTGGEAYDLCQALNTGHAGASTIHANSVKGAIPRMLSLVGQGEVIRAEAALPLIAAAFDFFIYLEHSIVDGSRKISEVAEIPSYPDFDQANQPSLEPRTIWKLNKETGEYLKVNEISDEMIETRGLNLERDLTWEELKELSKV